MRMPFGTLLPLMLFLVPGPGQAANLYRCLSPKGQASYQQTLECPVGHRLDRSIEYQPVADSVPASAAAKPKATARAPRTRSTVAARASGSRTKRVMTDNERCRAAREQRDRALQKLGLKRTYDDLGRLEEPVRAACRW